MDRLIGTLLFLIALAVALPAISAAAQSMMPVLIALLIGSVLLRWFA